MHALVHAADVQDRDGGVVVMATLFGLDPFLLKLYADGGYQGPQFQAGLRRVCRRVRVGIVKRSDQAKGFAVLPKRWIVERTISLAEPLPSAGQGLGVPQPQGSRLPALGFHSPYAPKALSHNKMIPDRLLENVGEMLRAALNSLAAAAPDWLAQQAEHGWVDRYGRRVEDYRLPKG